MTIKTDLLATELAGLRLQNPLLLSGGTAGYGSELAGVMKLDSLGGIVTKAVSLAPRNGAAAPRVADFPGGMINAVGLANPGVEEVKRQYLPWFAANVREARVLVNVVGFAVEEFAAVVAQLDDVPGKDGYELNVSCPNVRAEGREFGSDPDALAELVRLARQATKRPLFVKLSPILPDVARFASIALDAGADGITVINTMPGLAIDVESRKPLLGFGTGGVSGPGLLPVGVLATWRVWKATKAPIIGVGGVASATDLLQYIIAGASAVGIGTAALRDPRAPERIIGDLAGWCEHRRISTLAELKGSLQWPA